MKAQFSGTGLHLVAQDFRGMVLPLSQVPQKQQKGTFKSQWEDCPVKPLRAVLERLSKQLSDSTLHGKSGLADPSVCRNWAGSFYLDKSSEKAS